MARQLLVIGAVVVACVSAAEAFASDSPGAASPRSASRGIKVTSSIAAGEVKVVAEGPGVRFEQHAGDRGLRFTVAADDDTVSVHLTTSAATVARGGTAVTIARGGLVPALFHQVVLLLDGSAAARALDAIARDTAPPARGASEIAFAAAALRALQGDPGPGQALARQLAAPRSDRHLVRAMARSGSEAATSCYQEWESAVVRFMDEYFACEEAMRWLPLGGSLSCTYEWLFKVSIVNSMLAMCIAS